MIPWQQHCSHISNGWCIQCVSKLGKAAIELLDEVERYNAYIPIDKFLSPEISRNKIENLRVAIIGS